MEAMVTQVQADVEGASMILLIGTKLFRCETAGVQAGHELFAGAFIA
jgi:hypothetical protein